MSNIKPRPEEIMQAHRQFLSDPVRLAFIEMKMRIITRSACSYIISSGGLETKYPTAVQKQLDRIDMEMNEYVKAAYPILFQAP